MGIEYNSLLIIKLNFKIFKSCWLGQIGQIKNDPSLSYSIYLYLSPIQPVIRFHPA